MSECNACPTSESCSKDKTTCMVENNPMNKVKQIIGVMSGKGGVGKSTTSVLLARYLKQQGHKVGILDADITGPSIPRLLGVNGQKVITFNELFLPVETVDGIKIMSLNLLMEIENQPVIWRGPMISATVKQFWTNVLWDDLDYLIIDMPPGTGDVALTVMQSIPINGIIMVSVPQDLVSMIVSKAVNMATTMNMKVLGVIENMSYIICPECGKKIKFFEPKNDTFLKEMDLKLLGEMPMTKQISDMNYDEIESIFYPIAKNVENSLKELK